ncbi:protein Njmu-R1 isoform X2 [Latimeria chalumnae]|uniref:protein Njmu-R1 isoform X2 n=1 Tax=Latimeria chalumnae TaxID=7897 RepID=UPI0003C1AD57|nr:PREDICTED: protein Njmu-R1 isoform X2 [Latimeria chalumnae]|eukprot:XP_005993804.1 PREDICTED: protein Njmu-R1 isoform X2 [Latimeria chalumnae]
MFTTQTSFQESIDGEEKETDLEIDDGALIEEEKRQSQTNSYYSIYVYQSHTTSLSLADTNLPAEAELELRSFITKRLSKGMLFRGMGVVVSVELSIPEQVAGCYYCLLNQHKFQESLADTRTTLSDYVICFLGGTEKGLELFRLELDNYVQGLQSFSTPEISNLEAPVKLYLTSWFEESVIYIKRVVQLLQEKLVVLLHAALSHTSIEVKGANDRTKTDINRFLNAASLQGLVQEDTESSLCKAISEEQQKVVILDCDGVQPQFQNAGSNRFCEDWIQAFLNGAECGNPFLLRQILENFKLKAIQDMNNIKRFIRQAEMSHYALFKCYIFLKNCGNADILLQNVKVEHAEMPEAKNVVQVLEEFIDGEGMAGPSI